MIRTTPILPIAPIDNRPIPIPKLTFGIQKANAAFPTGGLISGGSVKFNVHSLQMVQLAKDAFTDNSSFKNSPEALNLFLLSLSVTSAFEAGFDGINTYDRAGVSIGFLQFARPEGGAGRLMELAGRRDLADTLRKRFGKNDPHNSADAVKARFDASLMKELVLAASSPAGIKAQLAMSINKNVDGQLYFEKTYAKFLELKLTDPLSCSLLFDSAINMGVGALSKFSPCMDGLDGKWISTSISLLARPERRTGWAKLLSSNFA